MSNPSSLQRSEPKAGALIGAVTFFCIAHPAFPQEEKPDDFPPFDGALLAPVVVSANKYPHAASRSGSAVSVLEGSDLEKSQIRSLENALVLVPGAITASSGARGSITSVFLRGTESDQVQVLVDGIRVSDSNILPNPFLGGENLHNLGSLEVLRGPQSSLYGGEAIGGVVSLFTHRGSGDPSLTLFGEAGSFGTLLGSISGQGEIDDFAYAFSIGTESTQNVRANNDFEQYQSSLRLDFNVAGATTLAFTLRQAWREYGSPGDVTMNDPDNLERDDTVLLGAHLESRLSEVWETRLHLGVLLQEFESEAPPAATTVNSNRIVTDWRNIFEFFERHTTLLGFGSEQTSIENNGFGAIDATERVLSAYGQHTVRLSEAFEVTGGIRYEEYDSVGRVWTHRATASYEVPETGTRIHGSYGSGFRAPSFLDLYGTSAFYVGNPALIPEESRGWDIGIEQRLGEEHLLDVTWFRNDIENLIDFDFSVFPGTVRNVNKAVTEGLEVAVRGTFRELLDYSLAYTWLEAHDESTGTRLLRRPRHTLGFDANARVCERLLLGFGGHYVLDREDFGVLTSTTIQGDDYFTARAYAAYDLAEDITLSLRIENAFDREYDEIDGFPGLPFGAYAGLTIEF